MVIASLKTGITIETARNEAALASGRVGILLSAVNRVQPPPTPSVAGVADSLVAEGPRSILSKR